MKKTPSQLRVIQISREVDTTLGLKVVKKTNKYKDPKYQANYYTKNKLRLQQYKRDYHIRRKYGLS